MKKQLITALMAFTSISAWAQAPAFPGAEGFARYITGGRGEAKRITLPRQLVVWDNRLLK